MKKYKLGQYFTKYEYWKQKQIIKFIKSYKFKNVLDPFAGKGDLLKQFNIIKNINTIGLDIDKSLKNKWIYNDSLKNIKFYKNTFVITNPPFLSKTSSKRKKINHKAFKNSKRNDLYKIALDKLIESRMPGVVIIPESFVNSSYDKKNIHSITIIIPNPFKDTTNPICVVCYDPKNEYKKIKIYKNDKFIGYINGLKKQQNIILKSNNQIKILFNNEKGELALIAYDSSNGKKIKFLESKNLTYNKPQKKSSRLVTKIHIDKYVSKELINKLNKKLSEYRAKTKDVFLTPFKGNNNLNERRRRLDYKTARKIINSVN